MKDGVKTGETKCLGLVRRRSIWLPTLKGMGLLVVLTVACGALLVRFTPTFLAPNEPVRGELLVMEGWAADYAVVDAIQEFKAHGYKLFASTGGPLETGHWLTEYKTIAEMGAARAKLAGLDPAVVISVPSIGVQKDRTYASAEALKEYLQKNHPNVKTLDVYSAYVHSRRSWMLFQMAMGPEYKIGIIAGRSKELQGKPWWKTSFGVRTVMSETIAYLYARILFRP